MFLVRRLCLLTCLSGNDKRSLLFNPFFSYTVFGLNYRQSDSPLVDNNKSLEHVSTVVPTRNCFVCFQCLGIHLSELNHELKEKTPPGYELYGYEEVQNRMFARYPSIYSYRQCVNCGYSIPAYGKPYSILFRPTINNTVPNNTVIMVCTQPSERHLRDLFRKVTESKRRYYNIEYFFALTQDPKIANCTDILKEEQSRYHDLLVFDHPNSYRNLVLTVLLSFHYLQSLELSSRYIVKVDADVALNIPRLMQLIYQPKYMRMRTVYMGDCLSEHYNTRNNKRKSFVPSQIVGKSVIKSYARGGLYVLSRETLIPLLIGVRHNNVITHQEDNLIRFFSMYNTNNESIT